MLVNLLASSIANVPHLAAFAMVDRERLDTLDLSVLLVYMLDAVPAEALPYLAEQFDMLNYKGYGAAKDEQERRDILKRAFQLHRKKGTPWSIHESLRNIGFGNIEIMEGVSARYNGDFQHDATITYGGANWAAFKVDIILDHNNALTFADGVSVYRTILEYKNERSTLVGFDFIYQNGHVYSFNQDGQATTSPEPI